MKHVFASVKNLINEEIVFRLSLRGNETVLSLSAAPFFKVFFDGKLVSFGPERTASGYSRVRNIPITPFTREISVLVISYGVPSYDCDFQRPFFGAVVYKGKEVAFETDSFKAFHSSIKHLPTSKYSFQRGFIERFDFRNLKLLECETIAVDSPILLSENGDPCKYLSLKPKLGGKGSFASFGKISIPSFLGSPSLKEINKFDVKKDFLDVIQEGDFFFEEYDFSRVITGFINVKIVSDSEGEAFIVFDESKVDGAWSYGRSSCNDLITVNFSEGKYEAQTSLPYSFRYIMVIHRKGVNVNVSATLVQNDCLLKIDRTGDKRIDRIIEAASNTFAQNAVDIYTDCPGRERAGWLCDSYFTAKAERFFLKSSNIEHNFLENFLLYNSCDIEKGMFPMCFPSKHSDHVFIPNWAMFYVLELEEYYYRTNDKEIVLKAQKKIYELLNYFKRFENHLGLLEELRNWVFIEWSGANSPDFLEGVNFPTNILYSRMLQAIGNLYRDTALLKKASKIRREIYSFSYIDGFYHDNAIRINGKLETCTDHISETCQYYALYFDMPSKEEYRKKIKENFGPYRKKGFENVVASNAFIGFILRLWWLLKEKEYEMIKNEAIAYFEPMAMETSSLWEHKDSSSSLNHGFASSVAPLLFEAFILGERHGKN